MTTNSGSGAFKAPMSRNEARHDAISRSAQEIIARDAALRTQMMDRLRAARLARDAALAPPAAVAPKKPRKKVTAKGQA